MPELLLVGVGLMGRPYLAAARRLGLRVHAVESPDRAEALAGEVDHLTPVGGSSDEHWAAAAAAAAAARPPDGVVAFAEPQVLGAALVADAYSLPGPSLAAALVSRNKALQRGRFAAAGIRQPEHLIAGDLAAGADWAASRFPVVVKPLTGTASIGVRQVSDAAGYAELVRLHGDRGPLLVERAASGPEYSWEALVQGGKVWVDNVTAKDTTGPPAFIETGHRVGQALPEGTAAAVRGLGAEVLAALGMRDGIVHLECRVEAEGATLMEIAVRTPGDFIMDLLCDAYGFDWFEAVLRLATGMPLPEPPTGPIGCGTVRCLTPRPGVITAVDGLEEVRAHPNVVRAIVHSSVGDEIPPLRSSEDLGGALVLTAPDRATLDAAMAFATSTLRIETRPR